MTYLPITTSSNGISKFDHQVIHFLVSLPLEISRLQRVTKLKKQHHISRISKMKERAKECLLSHPLFHGDQAFDLLDTSQEPSCVTTKIITNLNHHSFHVSLCVCVKKFHCFSFSRVLLYTMVKYKTFLSVVFYNTLFKFQNALIIFFTNILNCIFFYNSHLYKH